MTRMSGRVSEDSEVAEFANQRQDTNHHVKDGVSAFVGRYPWLAQALKPELIESVILPQAFDRREIEPFVVLRQCANSRKSLNWRIFS